MKKFKKLLRIILLVFLILLASIGIPLGGALPIRSSNRRDHFIEITTAETRTANEDKKNTQTKKPE